MKAYLVEAIKTNNILPLSSLRPYLWKDEINDVFLLSKNMEIYLYWGYNPETIKKAVLGCYCWSTKITSQLRKKELIFEEWGTDDGLVTFKTDIKNLPLFLYLGAFKRRPNIKGEWIKDKERRLSHKIIPYKYCKETKSKKTRSDLQTIPQL